ncbi:actin-like ATPase domain-containing protein [Rhizophagus irregularis]|nr:actin-like ATPase domain-containing protein [Rhizophagus irregularis]
MDIRVVVAIVLQYDSNYQNVIKWGNPALAQRQSRKNKGPSSNTVELFKLHLGDIPQDEKPSLPHELSHKKAISDYLHEFGKTNQILRIIVPAEFDDRAKDTMRKCLYDAELTSSKKSTKVEFTTEPEAAAIYCMRNLRGQNELIPINASYMVVDCGGGTVDLTTRKLLEHNKLGEITERTGDFCGGSYVDQEFLKFLSDDEKFGESTINLLRENNYGQLQYMIQQFCQKLKFHFTGSQNDFDSFEFDIEEICPVLKQYCKDDVKDKMEENDWIIEINFEDLKSMFDPVVEKIIRLIRGQLDSIDSSNDKCSAIFLVGGFSESKYLQLRVREEFETLVLPIIVPKQPIAAIVRGACDYGLEMSTIVDRTLKYTYGIRIVRDRKAGDPKSQRVPGSRNSTYVFDRLVTRGARVGVDQKISEIYIPHEPYITELTFLIYKTTKLNAKYCNEPGVTYHGELVIDLPDVYLGLNREVEFSLIFGKMELIAEAKNVQNKRVYNTRIELNFKNK